MKNARNPVSICASEEGSGSNCVFSMCLNGLWSSVWDTAQRMFIGVEGLGENLGSTTF